MDCAACGKPLSVTAKFCGKCGAPVKRGTKAPDAEATIATAELPSHAPPEQEVLASASEYAPVEQVEGSALESEKVEDLVVNLTPAHNGLDDSNLMMIDLNLEPLPNAATSPAMAPAVVVESSSLDHDLLHKLEQHQSELKKTLEKHSLLLDFISLASQQQSHQQAQPDPNEELLHNLIEQQTQFAVQLAELQNHIQHLPGAAPGRVPEEYKLLLEKQKVEIQKSFSQNISQNTENITSTHQAEWAKVQEMLKANTLAAEAIEKNLAPLIQSVNDLKTKVQVVVKKVEEQANTKPKAGSKEDPPSEGGGGMVFVIGMLCGLTVVLCSLAIYNFLSHDSSATDSTSKGHDKAATESTSKGHEKVAPESSPHSKPAH